MTASSAAAVPLPHHSVTEHRDSTRVDSTIFVGLIITVMFAAAAAAAAGSDLLATDPCACILRRLQADFSSLPRSALPCAPV